MAIESPLRGGIVEAGPDSSHCNLVGMLVLHRPVEILEIALAPVAAIGGPAAGTRLHPGVSPRKIIRVLCWRLVLVDQQRRPFPMAAVLPHAIPVDVFALGKNEDHGPAIVGEV